METSFGFHLRRAVQQVRYGIAHVADPFAQAGNLGSELGHSARLLVGIITDSVAPAYAYRVQFGDGHPVCLAYLAIPSATGAAGLRSTMTLPVGTRVLCVVPPWPPTAYIIGVLPNFNAGVPDMLFLGSRQRVDEAHFHPINMADKSVYDACGGRFFDATTVGEVGWVAETGLRLHLDPFLVTLAVDEACGVFGFYHDQLLRIAGYNFQERTAGREYECLDDQGEYIEYEGSTPYPWENLGLWEPGEAFRTLEDEQWQKQEPWYGPMEPKDDRQQGWHRIQRYGGYLGQGGKRLIVAPPKERTSAFFTYAANADEEPLQFPGLFAETIGLDGRYTLESAKGISIVKHCAILAPVRRRRPEQNTPDTGDCLENYRPSGKFGEEGPEHEIQPELRTTGDSALQRAAGLLDFHAYLFNYAGIHPFHWHAKEWSVPDGSDLDYVEREIAVPDWSCLARQFSLPAPAPYAINVDHRLQGVAYYPTTCGIDLLDDGGVVIHGGCGEEIRMAGGHIWISAPGDIWLQSGRNVNTWAGYDAIIKAQNCIEGTATKKDVRFKAEQHFQVLAGNRGDNGGILLESRSTESQFDFSAPGSRAKYGGIILKSKSGVSAIGQTVYLRTTSENGTAGPILLDADRGQAALITKSSAVRQFVQDGLYHYFGSAGDGETQGGNSFHKTGTVLGGDLETDGRIHANGSMTINGWITVTNGHIATEFADTYKNKVNGLSWQSLAYARDAFAALTKKTKTDFPDAGNREKKTLDDGWLQATGFGNYETLQRVEFTLRSRQEYRTTAFTLFESRWQQLARLSNTVPATWEETAIRSTLAGSMYPYPGGSSYDSMFCTQDLGMFDVEKGLPKSRGDAGKLEEVYRTAEYQAPSAASLLTYPVAIGVE